MFLKKHLFFMEKALEEAKIAFFKKEVPIGAILVFKNNIISVGHNEKKNKQDITSHAEIEVIKKASKIIGNYNLKFSTIYVTMEPCPMCLGAIIQSGIKTIIFGAKDKKMGAIESYMKYYEFPNGKKLSILGGILEDKCLRVINKFFKKLR